MFAFDIVSMTKTQFYKMSDRNAYHNDIPDVFITPQNIVISNYSAYQSVEVTLHQMVVVCVVCGSYVTSNGSSMCIYKRRLDIWVIYMSIQYHFCTSK